MKNLKLNNIIFLCILGYFIAFVLFFKAKPLTKKEVSYYTERCIKYEGNPTYVLNNSGVDVIQVICS